MLSRKPLVTMKPGAGGSDKFTRAAAELLAATPLERDPWMSESSAATAVVAKGVRYHRPDRRGVMAGREEAAREERRFVASSSYSATFGDYVSELLRLRKHDEEEYKAVFERLDRDGSGNVDLFEMRALLTEVYGTPPSERELRLLMGQFDTNSDGVISWEEFSSGLQRAREAMEDGVPTKRVTRRVQPGWMRRQQKKRVLSAAPMVSSDMRDMAGATDRSSTTRDLFEGTSKSSAFIPGYSGHIPKPGGPVRAGAHASTKPTFLRDSRRRLR